MVYLNCNHCKMETRSRKLNKKSKSVFVTVGTTKFDRLVETVCETTTLEVLSRLGYDRLTLQIGSGEFEPPVQKYDNITIEHYRFKSSIKEDIDQADLVISHAGAGSCLETLGAGKKLLVVINEDLMGNHQLELAYQLSKDGHLHYTICSNLAKTLEEKDFSNLVPFKKGNPEVFADFLDKLMGFS